MSQNKITNIAMPISNKKHNTAKVTIFEIGRTDTEAQSIMVAKKFIFPHTDTTLSVGIKEEFIYTVRTFNYETGKSRDKDFSGKDVTAILLNMGYKKAFKPNLPELPFR